MPRNAIDQLRAQRKRLTAPRKLQPHETVQQTVHAMLNDVLDGTGL